MPMVHANLPNGKNSVSHYALRRFCEEIIPAALNSAEGPLRPGDVIFIHNFVDMPLEACATLEVKAQFYEDREKRLDEIAVDIATYLRKYFRGVRFNVCVELVIAGWSFASDGKPFNGDMSLEAAYKRLTTG